MSEIFDTYMQQISPHCWNCPVLKACVESGIASERSSDGNTEALQRIVDRPSSEIPELDALLQSAHGELLEMSTTQELMASKAVAQLTEGPEPCRGTKRGAPDAYPLRYKLVDFILNKRSCRSPGLHDLLKD